VAHAALEVREIGRRSEVGIGPGVAPRGDEFDEGLRKAFEHDGLRHQQFTEESTVSLAGPW
jgi:hypothetical protein